MTSNFNKKLIDQILEENIHRRTKEDQKYLENIRQESLPETSFDDIVGQEEAKVALIQVRYSSSSLSSVFSL